MLSDSEKISESHIHPRISQPSSRAPSLVTLIEPVGSQAPIPQRSYSPPASSAIPVSPASSSSSLVESSEGSTTGENEFETPEAAI
jgi:hypothetical protein